MSYEPKPGGIPDRVIKWLKTQPWGAWHTNERIANACGCGEFTIQPNLASAEQHNAVTRSKYAGKTVYHLGTSYCVAPPPPNAGTVDVTEVPEGLGASVVAAAEDDEAPNVFDTIGSPAADEPEHLEGMEEEDTHFACALYSDGRFHLELGADSMTLTEDQAQVLRDYLYRVSAPS